MTQANGGDYATCQELNLRSPSENIVGTRCFAGALLCLFIFVTRFVKTVINRFYLLTLGPELVRKKPQEIKKAPLNKRGFLVEVTGFEPAASWSRTKRATNCATPRR